MKGKEKSPIPLYSARPPPWLPPAHSSARLGHPGYYPPRSSQEEDVLSVGNVKNGFSLPLAVPSENSTLQHIASECLNDSDTIGKLEELINQVFLRRSQHLPSIPTSSFRIPSRVTLNDTKRQAWFADLADPTVPLNKLGKSVPHGAKGHDLLDLLQSNNVAISRAVWFLRVFGANETAGLRNKPSYNPTQYSVEWAGVVTSYMKKQLAEIALPSAPRPGMNIKQTFKGVLADPATRERWTQRFSYCLTLLQSFYWEGMVDHRTFLVWIVHQMGTCNLAQAGFIARIADEYLEGMMLSRPLASHFVSACVSKLSEIASSPSKDFLMDTESILKDIVKRLCLALPDAFVSPKLWQEHAILLDIVLREDLSGVDSQSANRIRHALARHFDDIQRRNEAMLFVHMPPLVTARLGWTVRNIKILNSISKQTNINSVSFFSDDLEDTKQKLDLLLTWCVTPLQFGDHRPFAAVTLIHNWRQRASTRALRRECRAPDEFLQDQLFTWLDTSEVAVDRKVLHTVSLVFGKLVQRQLFSYERYIQRLVARSEVGLCVNDLQESRHRNFLRWISLTESSHISQRKIALYGIRVRQVPEDANEKEMRRELRTILPIFNGASTDVLRSPEALFQKCSLFLKAPRYEQVRTLKSWLLPILQDRITRTENVDDVVLKSYCLAVELAAQTKCFSTMLKLTLAFLEHSATPEALNTAIDTVCRFVTIWTCMDAINSILESLETAHLAWKGRGVQSRSLLFIMNELDQGRYLTPQAREQLQTDRSIYSLALQPLLANPPVAVPHVLPEILVLVAGNADPQAPSTLANTLWVKYRMSYDWAWKVWDNTIASLRQIPVMIADEDGRRECALRYAHFLCHIDQHLPSGIDDEVLRWLKGPGKNEVALLSAESWDIVAVLLLFMVIQGALKTTTIMTGLVYPAWKLGASASTTQQAGQTELFLTAANNLVKALLLCEEGTSIMTPPSDIFDIQRLQTRKEDVYCDSHFPELVHNIPIIVSLENNDVIAERLRAEVKAIRHSLYEDEDFRRGTFHNLDAIRDAFEHAMNLPENTSPEVGERIVAALRMIFSETPDEDIEIYSWPEKSSLLSPWMISATTIQLRFFWTQMERSFKTHAKETAIVKLDKFTSVIFDHSLSSDEASFVTQMTHGVGSAVAGRIINNGLRFLTAALQKDDPSCIFQTGESFRMLIYIAEPLRKNSLLPALQADVQDDIFSVLCRRFSLMDVQCRESSGPCPQETLTQKVVLLARLLQFDLGFEGAWTPNTTTQSRELCQTLYRLALFHATGPNYDAVVFSLLFDTLLFLVDETPIQNKLASFDPFTAYPTIDPDQLNSNIPPEHLKQLRSLLPSLPSISTISDLGTFRRDNSGNLVLEGPVVNRPWEWTENLGDPSILDPKEAEREKEEKKRLHVKYLVKNAGSLSLETFGARMTGDGILESKTDDLVIEGNLRAFEDGLSAESIFKRDWRETRLEVDGGSMMISQQGKLVPSNMEASSSAQGTRVQSRASPTSSVHSRSSARASGRRGSSSVNRSTASNASEIIDVDMLPTVSSSSKRTASGSKRKAATVSDDEVIIVEGPVASTSRAKKPRTASKSVASKTKPRKK